MTEASTDIADLIFPSKEVARCPYPAYAALRSEEPVHKVPGRNEYLVTRYDDITFVLLHPEIFSSVTYVLEDGARRPSTLEDFANRDSVSVATFQSSDRPAHTWKRRLASAHFRAGQMEQYEPTIRETVSRLIDSFPASGEVEFINAFARPLGAEVTMLIMGLPLEDAHYAEAWGRYDGQGTPYHEPERQAAIAQQVREMFDYIDHAIREKQQHPRDDVLSRFVTAHVEANGVELGLEHAKYDAFSVLLGGAGTSSHMLGNILLQLLRNPDQMQRVRADRTFIAAVIEEGLRSESPIQWNLRKAIVDVTLGGVDIEAGAEVLLLFGSGNRDDGQFPDAERFDIGRENARQHLAFGHGLHLCLGAPLARLEAQLALEGLLERTSSIELAGGDSSAWLDSLAFRGLEHLDIVVSS